MNDQGASTGREGRVRVVGTAHVSSESVREVEDTIEDERPDVVAVELDEGRYRQLQGETPDDIEPGDLLRGNTVFQFLAYWMLSYVQSRLGEKFDVTPGADMMAAVDSAEELGIDVALVDRDIQTTIQRFWARLGPIEKARLVGGLVFGVTDARGIGLALGVAAGVIAGPLLGLFGPSLGLTLPILTRITGGVLLAIAVGLVVHTLADAVLGPDEALIAGGAVGVAAGLLGGVGLGLADGVVASLGPFVARVVGSLALGLAGGVSVGLVAGWLADRAGYGAAEADELDDFDVAELTDADVVSVMMEEFRTFSPAGARALIDERDAYIAHELVRLREAGRDVVAVVGAGHREGIEGYLDAPETLPPWESLVGTDSGGGVPWLKAVGVLVSVGFVAFFVLLAMAGVRDGFLLRLFAAWFVVNGVFAAGLARLAGARWSSTLVGGLVAWMTSVNPLLAPGWFTGYVELRHNPVNVADIGTLNELLSDEEKPIRQLVGEMFEVPLFKLIMVVAMTNVGSMIASLLFAVYVLPLFATEIGGIEGVSRLMVEGARNSAELLWRTVT
ncbi:TraB/GumN family protein [Haloplanus rallus]|jgi:pheromone shutdown protein TraB|uniref:TraB/GumN family protein n=1 Tax=Haloplanus rallus TaxID=1816183 RepID=A0A6B9FC47_9EURY|nr:TraB/GumN family protein [Haloplanus rallus]QGX96567.1 TraB/GumN family protein [Haloplanus rallus]